MVFSEQKHQPETTTLHISCNNFHISDSLCVANLPAADQHESYDIIVEASPDYSTSTLMPTLTLGFAETPYYLIFCM